jgi:hypothetical protein
MQVVPNQADVHGRLVAWSPNSDVEGYGLATIHVVSAKDVPGFANLIEQHAGREIPVYMPTGNLEEGSETGFRARMTGPGRFFAMPKL